MNQKGVTLIELLIVIVVAGISSTFAIPSVATIFNNVNKDKVLSAAITIEESARLYCITSSCEEDQILTKAELGKFITQDDPTYTYSVTIINYRHFAVSYYKDGEYSFPFDTSGNELENKIPSLSSRNEVNILGQDDSGNEPDQPVIPEGEPYILLNGPSVVYVEITNPYDDPGGIAYTSEGTPISNNVWSNGTVDYWTLGTYTKTYNLYSSFDGKNCIPAVRTIIVVDATAPIIYLDGSPLGDKVINRSVNSWYSDPGVWAQDNSWGPTTLTSSGTVDINTVGVYVVTYTATDPSGNVSTATITVNVY